MKKTTLFNIILVSMFLAACSSIDTTTAVSEKSNSEQLIPLELLFGNPSKTNIKISPDGKRISYLAASENNVLNVWIKTIGKNDDKMITSDSKRGIREYEWAFNGEQIYYVQDKAGDENWQMYVTDIDTGRTRNLTPFEGVRAQNYWRHHSEPDVISVALNKKDPKLFDMYKINLKTGEIRLVAENPGDVILWIPENTFKINLAIASDPSNGDTLFKYRSEKGDTFKTIFTVPFGEQGFILGFDETNENILVNTSMGTDTSRVIAVNCKTGEKIKDFGLAENADLEKVLFHPVNNSILALGYNYLKFKWKAQDKEFEKDLDILRKNSDAEPKLVSSSADFETWIVKYKEDASPFKYYLYDRKSKKASFLFSYRPELEKYKLAKMKPVIIKTRDNLEMVSYLTLPNGIKHGKYPLILNVHGGPWTRDRWGYHPAVQMFANRGYAVLQVNYRGSKGFGKKHLTAGYRQWGKKMQDDLTDAVKWAIEENIADPDRVAIYGGSYGGYAVLAGLTFTPDLYACGVDFVGISNVKTFMQSIPPYWKSFKKEMVKKIGDVENNEELNREISPIFHVRNIKSPLLIAQGKNDPRVKKSESDQMVEEMQKNNLQVEYVVYDDEGHGFKNPENELDFFKRVETFLSKCLKKK